MEAEKEKIVVEEATERKNVIRSWDGTKRCDHDDNTKFTEPYLWFIRVLISVNVAYGFGVFVKTLDFDRLIKAPPVVIITILAFFIAGYFFVISNFIFYHTLIEVYPYIKGNFLRFLWDVWVFFLLFIILYLANFWPTPRKLWAFTLVLGLWHFCVWFWHIIVNWIYDRFWWRGVSHATKFVLYFTICYIFNKPNGLIKPPAAWTLTPESAVLKSMEWVWLVTGLIIAFNLLRIFTFLNENIDVTKIFAEDGIINGFRKVLSKLRTIV